MDQEAPNLARISLKRELWHLNKLGGSSVASVNGVATTLIGELAWGSRPWLMIQQLTGRHIGPPLGNLVIFHLSPRSWIPPI